MWSRILTIGKIVVLLLVGSIAALLGHRIYTSLQGPPLEPGPGNRQH